MFKKNKNIILVAIMVISLGFYISLSKNQNVTEKVQEEKKEVLHRDQDSIFKQSKRIRF